MGCALYINRMQHNSKCKLAFGRPTKEVGACPRCDELRNGAAPRKGWSMSYNYQMKHGVGPEYERWKRALDAHNCDNAKCGPVCTYGDW